MASGRCIDAAPLADRLAPKPTVKPQDIRSNACRCMSVSGFDQAVACRPRLTLPYMIALALFPGAHIIARRLAVPRSREPASATVPES
jgi:hypothetical protein